MSARILEQPVPDFRIKRSLVERECWSGDHHTIEHRLFINSISADTKRFAHAVRGHWGVENRLHWRLDVVFNEDASRIRKGHAPAITTAIRHLCINLIEQEPSDGACRRNAARLLGTTTTALRRSSADGFYAPALTLMPV